MCNTERPLPSPRIFLALVLWLISATQPAHADDPWQPIESALSSAHDQARLWQWGWTAGYGGALAFHLYQSSENNDPDKRYDARVRSVTNVLALSELWLNPLPHAEVYQAITDLKASKDTQSEPGRNLREAEYLWLLLAQDEQNRRSWRARLGGLIVATLSGIAIGVGDNRPRDGWEAFGMSLAVKEIQIRTIPTVASDSWNRYTPNYISYDGKTRLPLYTSLSVTAESVTITTRF